MSHAAVQMPTKWYAPLKKRPSATALLRGEMAPGGHLASEVILWHGYLLVGEDGLAAQDRVHAVRVVALGLHSRLMVGLVRSLQPVGQRSVPGVQPQC